MLGLGLSLQKGVSAFNAGRALVSSYIRRVTDAGGVLQNTACDVAAINELNQDRLLEPASWVLVPDGIKEDVVYTQKPSTGLGDLTFTRASDATYTDASGVVRRSPYNLFTFSEQFDNAAWSKTLCTITANQIISPSGYLNADLVTTSGIGDTLQQSVSVTSGMPYTFSGFIKSGSANAIGLVVFGSIPTCVGTYNLTNGTATSGVGSPVVSIQNYGNGWYRATLTATATSTGTANFYFTSSSADAVSTYYVWGAQLVEGSSALDYFPTTNRQDVPRIDFRNADGTLSSCGRLLLEPQRTNLALYSENFDNAGWAKQNATITANQTTSPSGYVDADLYTATGTSDYAQQGVSGTSGTAYTISCFVKNGDANSVGIVFAGVAYPVIPVAEFNLLTQTATVTAGTATASIQNYGNGWYRIVATSTAGATGNINARIVSLSGSAVSTFYLWGAQVEVGAYPTTYIPTTTAAVTRLADTASKTGVSSLIGQTEGTLFLDFYNDISINASSDSRFQLSDGSTANWIFIGFPEGNSKLLRFRVANSGSVINFFSNTNIIQGRNKVAFAYKNGDFVGYLNGVQVGSNTTALDIPSCSRIDLQGAAPTNPALERENIAQAALFPTRLTNDQLEVLTSEGYGNYALLAQSLNYVLQ